MRSEFVSRSPEETIRKGKELSARLKPPVVVMLWGELGSGKTTLAKGIINGLGAAKEEEVTSPSFTLVHAFHNHCKVYHVDLYRVEGLRELETLALEDILSELAVVLVEWPERLALRVDRPSIHVRLEHLDEHTRSITISDLHED